MVKNFRLDWIYVCLIFVSVAVFVLAAGIDNINLVFPINESFTNESNDSIEFIFNYTGENATASCELFINSTGFGVNSAVINDTNTTMLANDTISEGFHSWYVNCTNDTTIQSDVWFFTVDVTAPAVSLVYPTSTNYSSLSELNFSITDDNLATCWYSTNSSVNITTDCATNVTGLIPEIQGLNTWTIYVNDSAGNENSSSVVFTYDTVNPQIDIAYPANISYAIAPTNFNFTYTETNCDKVWYSNNSGVTNYSVQDCGINFTGMITEEGSNTWIVYMNDSAGNENSSSVVFTVDVTAPSVTVNSPTPTTYISASVSLNVTLNEVGFCLYSFDAGSTNVSMSSSDNLTFSKSVSLSDGSYVVNYYCNDSIGKLNDTENVSFSVSVPASESTSSSGGGYPQYYPTALKLESGYEVSLRRNYKVNFEVLGDDHVLTVSDISGEVIDVVVSSEIMNFEFKEGDVERVDFDKDGYYDFEILLKSVNLGRANFVLKSIYSEIEEVVDSGEEVVDLEEEVAEDAGTYEIDGSGDENGWGWLWVILIVMILAVIAWKKGIFGKGYMQRLKNFKEKSFK